MVYLRKRVRIRKWWVIGLVGLVLGLLGLGIVLSQLSGFPVDQRTSAVTVTRTGFVPRIRLVRVQTAVTFSTIAAAPFWPASDPHPQHTVYAPFDPQRALAPDESWSFTFTKPGVYHYHDHINPIATGEIIVLGTHSGTLMPAFSIVLEQYTRRLWRRIFPPKIDWQKKYAVCDAEAVLNTREICWKNILAEMVDNQGIDQTLRTVAALYTSNTTVAGMCHVLIDFVGEYAYERYREGERFSEWALTTQCAAGFYHGFMSEYMSHSRNYAKTQEFCNEAARKIPDNPQVSGQCMRGVGNGLAYMYATLYWKNIEQILHHSLEDCKRFSPGSECIDGVFSGIDHMYFVRHGYSLDMNEKDPYWFCRGFDADLKGRCYERMTPPIYHFTGRDLIQTGAWISKLDDASAAAKAMVTLGELHMRMNAGMTDTIVQSDALAACRTFSANLADSCLRGLVQAILFTGERTAADAHALQFCTTMRLTDAEQGICKEFINESKTVPY